MTDISPTLKSKSDQLNAIDIMDAPLTITIRGVDVKPSSDQPVSIFFDGDDNKPYKPSLGMRRVIAMAWGRESDDYVGKQMTLYFEPSVTYAGEATGGIRVGAFSHIEKPFEAIIKLNRKQKNKLNFDKIGNDAPTKKETAQFDDTISPEQIDELTQMLNENNWAYKEDKMLAKWGVKKIPELPADAFEHCKMQWDRWASQNTNKDAA